MASITYPRGQVVSVTASPANSTAQIDTTLGPFNISFGTFTAPLMNGLWLLNVSIKFGVPSANVNEEVLLRDILGNTVWQWHCNLQTGATVATEIKENFGLQGLVSPSISGVQQSWTIRTPATVNGPGYSVNMMGYIV